MQHIQYWLQPILNVNSGEAMPNSIVAYEFLCRWGGELSWLDRDHALLKALYNCAQLPSERLHINLGPASIIALNPHLAEPVFERFGDQLVLEWTEEPLTKTDEPLVAQRLRYWRKKYNVQISVDDFLAGHDGVNRVCLVEPDNVKIDGYFFRESLTNPSYADTLYKQCDWIKTRTQQIIIEHIEAVSDLVIACKAGASMGQGFLWNHLATDFCCPQQQEQNKLELMLCETNA
jgi:EAL domain-containing protein (putative c-di-GMP-specific phosphodiesterase class I)